MKRFGFIPSAQDRAAARARREQQRAERAKAQEAHQQRMYAASGVSSVALRCHQDTWKKIDAIMRVNTSWRSPSGDSVKALTKQMVEVSISGPNFVAILFRMNQLAGATLNQADRMFAHRVYSAFAQAAERVDSASPGRSLPPVVLDDQAAADDRSGDRHPDTP